MRIRSLLAALAVSGLAAAPAAAQADRPAPVLEFSAGYAAFLDDGRIDHAVVGGSVRWYITRRVSVGPELTYMIGPGSDRDLFVTGNVTVDLRNPRHAPRLVPYVVAGAGLFRHTDRFGQETFASQEGAVTAGVGFRLRVTPRVSIAPELRVGWEPHVRAGVTVAYQLGT